MNKRNRTHPAPPPERVELSDNPVKLCNEISRLLRDKMRQANEAEGVMSQPGAHLVLAFLATGDGRTQLELVKATHLKAPSVSLILKKMEQEGIVRREIDEKDARAVRVFLTEYGREIDREHINSIKVLDQHALKDLSDEEQQTLMRLLTKIRNSLMAEDEEGKKI